MAKAEAVVWLIATPTFLLSFVKLCDSIKLFTFSISSCFQYSILTILLP